MTTTIITTIITTTIATRSATIDAASCNTVAVYTAASSRSSNGGSGEGECIYYDMCMHE